MPIGQHETAYPVTVTHREDWYEKSPEYLSGYPTPYFYLREWAHPLPYQTKSRKNRDADLLRAAEVTGSHSALASRLHKNPAPCPPDLQQFLETNFRPLWPYRLLGDLLGVEGLRDPISPIWR